MRPTLHSATPRPAHPDDLTPDERRRELAANIAEGFRRLHARAALAPLDPLAPILAPQNLPDSKTIPDSGLAVPANPWLHGATG